GPKYVADGDVSVNSCDRSPKLERVCVLSVWYRNAGDQNDRPVIVTFRGPDGKVACETTEIAPPDAKGYGSNPNGGAVVRTDCPNAFVNPLDHFTVSFKVKEGS